MPETKSLQELAINTIRFLSADAVQQANSGHPGLPLGTAPMAYTIWTRHLRHNPANPKWPNRDRFILSGGHGCMLLYSLLHLTGYDLPLDELKRFRQWGSKTPGHPEFGLTPGGELFAEHEPAYQDAVLPPNITARLAVEAGITMGWHRWVGPKGRVLGIDRYGASAPANTVFEKLGLTVDNVVQIAEELI